VAYVFTGSGSAWTQQAILSASDTSAGILFGYSVALSGNTALVSAPYAVSGSPATSLWQMVASPCVPTSATVGGTFGDVGNSPYSNLAAANYNSTWGMYTYDTATAAYVFSGLGDAVAPGTGYWLKSYSNPTNGFIVVNGSATPVSTGYTGCASTNGCYAIPLTSTASASGLMNLVGNPLPYNVDWVNVRQLVDGNTAYTPSGAETAGYMSKSFSIWNGTAYATYDDVTPGMTGALQVFQSLWVKTLSGSNNHTLQLLIPAAPSTTGQAFPLPTEHLAQGKLPWYLGWLDWIVSPAAAEDGSLTVQTQAQGLKARQAQSRGHAQALENLKAWYVRLSVENSALGYKDAGNVLGQLADAKVGYDSHDLIEPPPFGTPYLTLVFPYKDWGDKAGAYASDYRPAQGLKPMSWDIEVRADQPGSEVKVTWQGHPRILARCKITDLGTGQTYAATDPSLANGLAVFMVDKVQRLTWRYLGGLGKP
jgi:hypothetical protein